MAGTGTEKRSTDSADGDAAAPAPLREWVVKHVHEDLLEAALNTAEAEGLSFYQMSASGLPGESTWFAVVWFRDPETVAPWCGTGVMAVQDDGKRD